MTVDEMNELSTRLAVQEQKLEAILETTKGIQTTLVGMQECLNSLDSRSAVQNEQIVVHEKKISHLESRVEKNSNDIARLEANANSALKTSRLIGVVLISMATLIVSVFGLFIR